MTDEEAADRIGWMAVLDDAPPIREAYRRAVAALRGRRALVDALENAICWHDTSHIHGGLRVVCGECLHVASLRAALETAKEGA